MTLEDKQQIFSVMVAKLILYATSIGYEVTLGEAYRPPETAKLYAEEGKGISNSLHTQKLAIDLNLFKDGYFLSAMEDYLPLGEWWEAQATQSIVTCWGGRFLRVDADHFSFAHNGAK